jgi:hypothetical protein
MNFLQAQMINHLKSGILFYKDVAIHMKRMNHYTRCALLVKRKICLYPQWVKEIL